MFGRRLTLFELCGFKIRLDLSWFLLAGLVAWSLASGYFPQASPGFGPMTYWLMGVVGVLALSLSVVVHELAHAVIGRRYGMQIAGITLFVFGGVAEMEDEPATPQGEWRMAVAGPLVSLGVAMVSLGLGWLLAAAVGADPAGPVLAGLGYLGFLNLLLAGFNMIPAFPLDGGRVLRAVLWAWRGDVVWATRWAAGAGGVLGLVLMAVGLWQALIGNTVAGAWWLVVGLFVRVAAAHAYHRQVAKVRRDALGIGRLMTVPVALTADMPVGRAMREVVERRPHAAYPVVNSEGRLLGCVEATTLATLTDSGRLVGDVMRPCGPAIIGEAADAAQALARMQRSGRTRLMVTRDGRLVGVLALADLLPELSIRTQVGDMPKDALVRQDT